MGTAPSCCVMLCLQAMPFCFLACPKPSAPFGCWGETLNMPAPLGARPATPVPQILALDLTYSAFVVPISIGMMTSFFEVGMQYPVQYHGVPSSVGLRCPSSAQKRRAGPLSCTQG